MKYVLELLNVMLALHSLRVQFLLTCMFAVMTSITSYMYMDFNFYSEIRKKRVEYRRGVFPPVTVLLIRIRPLAGVDEHEWRRPGVGNIWVRFRGMVNGLIMK